MPQFLIIYNISKKNNIRDLCYTAAANGFEVLYVSASDIHDLRLQQLISNGLQIQQFRKINECKDFLDSIEVPIVGIEIMAEAKSILDDPFTCNVAFMPGNEGVGMSDKQKSVCNEFVYIPQYGTGTASLNVNVATGLVLHRYSQWLLSNQANSPIEASTNDR